MRNIFYLSVVSLLIILGMTDNVRARECPKPSSQCRHLLDNPSGVVYGIPIPWNGDFPCAAYPYGQHQDACSGYSDPGQTRDKWNSVSFVDACNAHDRCYYTLGTLPNRCNTQYLKDLESACKSDLKGVLDPRYPICLSIAGSYYTAVVAFAGEAHPPAQRCQKKYEDHVRSTIVRGIYRRVLGREADTAGLQHHIRLLFEGLQSVESLFVNIANSQESRDNINNLYRRYLCRDAEPAGMEHHVGILARREQTLAQITQGIAGSVEAQGIRGRGEC